MVEYVLNLDDIFGSLADATRRDILRRVAKKELSISQIAKPYKLTFSAVSKHLRTLEKAKLIMKRRQGKQQFVHISPSPIRDATAYLRYYEKVWNERFDSLEIRLRQQR